MIDEGKRSVLGVLVSVVDMDAALEAVVRAAHVRRPLSLSALAVHGLMTGCLDPEYRYRLNRFDLMCPDGQPVRWALNRLHSARLPERVYGPRLTLAVCARAAQEGLPVFFYGSSAGVLRALEQNLRARLPGLVIAGVQPSRYRAATALEWQEDARAILESGARIVFAGLGCPRQEIWVHEMEDFLPMPRLAVGAAFDLLAGRLAMAPAWMQRSGLEWLHRLLLEPGRLWRRYLTLNPLFLAAVTMEALRLRRYDPLDCRPPAAALRFS